MALDIISKNLGLTDTEHFFENTKSTFIWDLDGTIIDSYEIIVDSLHQVVKDCNAPYAYQEIYDYVKSKSVNAFIELLSIRCNLDKHQLKSRYSEISNQRKSELKSMRNAEYILNYLHQDGVKNFIYTHKGKSTAEVLDNLNLTSFFTEVVTSEYGFERKPQPQGIHYILDKYKLNADTVFYVGDRQIDADCAKNAGVKSIVLADNPNSNLVGDYLITDFKQLVDFI